MKVALWGEGGISSSEMTPEARWSWQKPCGSAATTITGLWRGAQLDFDDSSSMRALVNEEVWIRLPLPDASERIGRGGLFSRDRVSGETAVLEGLG
jgi:hypothetical protein